MKTTVVTAGLAYLSPATERPYNYMYEPPAGTHRQNCEYRVSPVLIADARAMAPPPTIHVVQQSSCHQWAYFSEMDSYEALVFKQYDSQVSGVARFTPHSAFDLTDIPPDAPLRECIEIRCLVTYD
jgi:hypothetical protein